MIKGLIKALFSDEFQAEKKRIIGEARAVLTEAKRERKVKYITYDRMPVDGESFIYAMQPVTINKAVLSWLNGHKNYYIDSMQDALRVGRKDDVLGMAAQIGTIDALLNDLNDYTDAYENLLQTKKEEQYATKQGQQTGS